MDFNQIIVFFICILVVLFMHWNYYDVCIIRTSIGYFMANSGNC